MSRTLLVSSFVHSCCGDKEAKPGRWVWFSETTPETLERMATTYKLILKDSELTREIVSELPIFELHDKVSHEEDISDSLESNPEPTERQWKELVLMVGQQGSGKSTAASMLSYPIISEEEFNYRKAPFFRELEKLLSKGSVTVDGTNATRQKRKPIIELARKMNAKVRILWATLPGFERNKLREDKVPPVALVQYSKKFEAPLYEGDELEIVN